MKGFLIGISIILLTLLLAYACEQTPRRTERNYSGTVVLKDICETDMGDRLFTVYYYCPEISKNIKVLVTPSQYSKTKIGQKCTYYITPRQAKDHRDVDIIFPNRNK